MFVIFIFRYVFLTWYEQHSTTLIIITRRPYIPTFIIVEKTIKNNLSYYLAKAFFRLKTYKKPYI